MLTSCFYLSIDMLPTGSCVQLWDFRPWPALFEPTSEAQISCLPLQHGPSARFPEADIFSLQSEELRAGDAC